MGALTSKDSAFELRDWDAESTESFDPTDSLGFKTFVFIKENKIIQIEPNYDSFMNRIWLSDKGRQFFDSIFGKWIKVSARGLKSWSILIKKAMLILYALGGTLRLNTEPVNLKFFTVVFKNLGLEILSYFKVISEKYFFIKIKRAENVEIDSNLETHFQLNSTVSKVIKMEKSEFCLVVASNPRYEGYYLNLNLKKRKSKGNFKCAQINAKTTLTFDNVFVNSNSKIVKMLSSGTNVLCKELKTFKNPSIIFNTNLFKTINKQTIVAVINTLKFSNALNRHWQGINALPNSLSEIGEYHITTFSAFNLKDLATSKGLYFINLGSNNLAALKKTVQLQCLRVAEKLKLKRQMLTDQNSQPLSNISAIFKKKCVHVNTTNFYETEEMHLNGDGIFLNTMRAVYKKGGKSAWQIFRRVFIMADEKAVFSQSPKSSRTISFNSENLNLFKNYFSFIFLATVSLTNLNYYLYKRTQPFLILNFVDVFKVQILKTRNCKLLSWLNNFFTGGKDEYSPNSLMMAHCASNAQAVSDSFF